MGVDFKNKKKYSKITLLKVLLILERDNLLTIKEILNRLGIDKSPRSYEARIVCRFLLLEGWGPITRRINGKHTRCWIDMREGEGRRYRLMKAVRDHDKMVGKIRKKPSRH